jgi:hypothetical protein
MQPGRLEARGGDTFFSDDPVRHAAGQDGQDGQDGQGKDTPRSHRFCAQGQLTTSSSNSVV